MSPVDRSHASKCSVETPLSHDFGLAIPPCVPSEVVVVVAVFVILVLVLVEVLVLSLLRLAVGHATWYSNSGCFTRASNNGISVGNAESTSTSSGRRFGPTPTPRDLCLAAAMPMRPKPLPSSLASKCRKILRTAVCFRNWVWVWIRGLDSGLDWIGFAFGLSLVFSGRSIEHPSVCLACVFGMQRRHDTFRRCFVLCVGIGAGVEGWEAYAKAVCQ